MVSSARPATRPWLPFSVVRLTIYLGLVLVNVIIACAFTWFNWVSYKQGEHRRQLVDELSETTQRLAATLAENAGLHRQLLAQAREAGVLDERQRMARKIHDTLAQGLTGIITQLQAAELAGQDPVERRRHFDAAVMLARESLTEARRSVHALHPEPLETARLGEALTRVAHRWSERSGVQVTLTGTVRPVPPEAESALLRTAQEALANIARHAGATRAGLTLSYMDDEIVLDVRDDGKGLTRRGHEPAGSGWSPCDSGSRACPERCRSSPNQVLAPPSRPASRPSPGGPRRARAGGSMNHRSPGIPQAAHGLAGPRHEPIRVLIVDDHPVVRDGLRGIFDPDPEFEVVGEAGNGAEAVRFAQTLRPDVVLMDLRMPVMDGVTAITELASRGVAARVLVLTTYDTDSYVLPAIEAGATGYLLKDAPSGELLRAVRAAAHSESVLAPTVAARRLLSRVRSPGQEPLSQRELEVLELVAAGTANREAAARMFISEATVKTHLLHIYAKLGVSDRAAAVAEAYNLGLLAPDNRNDSRRR